MDVTRRPHIISSRKHLGHGSVESRLKISKKKYGNDKASVQLYDQGNQLPYWCNVFRRTSYPGEEKERATQECQKQDPCPCKVS